MMAGTDPLTGKALRRVLPSRIRQVYERFDDGLEQWIEVHGAVCGVCHVAALIGYPDEEPGDFAELAADLGWTQKNDLFVCPSYHRE